MSHLNSSFVPAGIGLWRSMAGAGVMAVGAVLAFHGLSDSASWLPPFVGIGDTLTGGIVFSAGLVLLLLPPPPAGGVPAAKLRRRRLRRRPRSLRLTRPESKR